MNNDALIAVLSVFIVTVIMLIIVWCYRNNSDQNRWQCVQGISFPIRKNPNTGNVECMSKDGINCEVDKCPDTSPVCPDKPAACGCDHMRTHGTTGYSDPTHWCNICDNYFREGYYW